MHIILSTGRTRANQGFLRPGDEAQGRLRRASRPGEAGGFSLTEVMVGVAIVGIVFTSLLSGFSAGFAMIQWSREDARATQILLEKLEQVRLFNWEQVTTNGLPATFTALFDPLATNASQGLVFNGTVTVTAAPLVESYSGDIRLITITLDWSSNRTPRHREVSTLTAKNGLSQYRY